jgi:hypothetical protein
MESWVGTNNLVFCRGYSFSKSAKEGQNSQDVTTFKFYTEYKKSIYMYVIFAKLCMKCTPVHALKGSNSYKNVESV